jgi:hypothetical protein
MGFASLDTNLYRYVNNDSTGETDASGMGLPFNPPLPQMPPGSDNAAKQIGHFLDGKIPRPPWLTDSWIEQYLRFAGRNLVQVGKDSLDKIKNLLSQGQTEQAVAEANRRIAQFQKQLQRFARGMKAIADISFKSMLRLIQIQFQISMLIWKILGTFAADILILVTPIECLPPPGGGTLGPGTLA